MPACVFFALTALVPDVRPGLARLQLDACIFSSRLVSPSSHSMRCAVADSAKLSVQDVESARGRTNGR
ncbi:unnamed protein product [Strongylus vulgaris]|uniref:Uncharacterized protein n=1 Tax=Strongylus vulgaris TaxID=40348 RepID=A0A3P7K9F1_STRVU|nr:unnamed protein product [Strongylus vulgaris]